MISDKFRKLLRDESKLKEAKRICENARSARTFWEIIAYENSPIFDRESFPKSRRYLNIHYDTFWDEDGTDKEANANDYEAFLEIWEKELKNKIRNLETLDDFDKLIKLVSFVKNESFECLDFDVNLTIDVNI